MAETNTDAKDRKLSDGYIEGPLFREAVEDLALNGATDCFSEAEGDANLLLDKLNNSHAHCCENLRIEAGVSGLLRIRGDKISDRQ